jgi:hypothetical protein
MIAVDWPSVVGDLLIFVGFGLTFFIYRREQTASKRRDVASVLATLTAVRRGMEGWGNAYFSRGYDDLSAAVRAEEDFRAVKAGKFEQIFKVPVEPLMAVIQRTSEGWLIDTEMIEAANIALWKLTTFNQLVQQHTDFNALHAAEICDTHLPAIRRDAIAAAAKEISTTVHRYGVDDARWYHDLLCKLDINVEKLKLKQQSSAI